LVISQTDQFSRKRHDKSLCDSNIAQCVIPAKLVLDLIGERESTHPPHYWIPAFAGMTRRSGQFELFHIIPSTGSGWRACRTIRVYVFEFEEEAVGSGDSVGCGEAEVFAHKVELRQEFDVDDVKARL